MNNGMDPRMLAMMLRNGGGGRSYNPGGGAVLLDPAQDGARRQMLALGLSGRRPPIHSWGQFGAEVAGDALEAVLTAKRMEQQRAMVRERASATADALRVARGRPAEIRDGYVDPDTKENFSINWNAAAPDRGRAIDMLTANPLTADIGVDWMAKDDEAARQRTAFLLEKGFEDDGAGGLRPIKGGYADPGHIYATKSAESGAAAAADAWKKAQEPHIVPEGGMLVAPPAGTYGPGTAPPGAPQRSGLMGALQPPGGGTQTVVRPAAGAGAVTARPLIEKLALEYGLDPAEALTVADIESGGGTQPDRAGSKYRGVFQLSPDLYRKYGGDPSNVGDQVRAGLQSLRDTKAALGRSLGREPTPDEVYLAHQQGVAGATALLAADRDARAADVIAPYYQDGLNVRAITGNLPSGTGAGADTTAGQFIDVWRGRYGDVAGRYGRNAAGQGGGAQHGRVEVADAGSGSASGGYQVVADNRKGAALKPQSDIGKLYADRDALPEGDPRRANFEAAISKASGQEPAAADKAAILEAEDKASSARAAIDNLERALALNARTYGPLWAKTAGVVAGLPGDHPDAEATVEYENLITGQALEQMKALFGAAPTEGERAALLDLQASLNKPREVRERIINRMMEQLRGRAESAQRRAQDLRAGTYFAPATTPQAQPQAAPSAAADPLGIR